MRLCIIVVLAAIILSGRHATAGPETSGSEKLYRQMEAELGKARTIECQFELVFQACPGGRGKGSILLAEENKLRIEMGSDREGRRADTDIIVSDGKKIGMIGSGASAKDVPKWLNQSFKSGFSRAGVKMAFLVFNADESKDFNADEAFQIMDFKLGEKETIGLHEAQLIRYTLVTKGLKVRKEKTRLAVSLWVDSKTKLPLKRIVVPLEKDLEFTLIETYSGLILDAKIDPRKFDLSNE